MVTNGQKGAVNALIDIYEKCMKDLQSTLSKIPDAELSMITDAQTPDENCRSLRTILAHVVNSGYAYAIYVNNIRNEVLERPAKKLHSSIENFCNDLDGVISFTRKIFDDIADAELEEFDDSKKMKTSRGQYYDIEQIMEHAIVHVLRHDRQIKKIIERNFQDISLS